MQGIYIKRLFVDFFLLLLFLQDKWLGTVFEESPRLRRLT